jgi:hypothetical protein
MRRANGAILGILFATVTVPAFAADTDDSGGSGWPVSFGTSRAHVDSVQGRLSRLFPIR